MITRASIFTVVAAGLAGLVASLHAEEIVVLGTRTEREPVMAVASGGALTLRLLLPVTLKSSGLSADLWQVAEAVALPLEKGLSLSEQATAPDAQGVSTVRVGFPEVKRKTQVLVKFFATEEPSAEIGRARVWIYPPADWAAVRRKFKEETPRLAVFGESATLRAFLKRRGVAFSDQGEGVPEKLETGVLALGELSAGAWRESKPRLVSQDGRLIVFVDDAAGLPGVYTTANGTGAVTQVTLPLLGGLAEDPRAESTFLQIIEQQLHAAPAAIF